MAQWLLRGVINATVERRVQTETAQVVTNLTAAPTASAGIRNFCLEKSNSGSGDWIHIAGMKFFGRHGVLPEEARLGQTFLVDTKLQVDTSRAGETDALEDTVNYAAVYSNVKGVVEGPPCKLLEAVAHQACAVILREHPAVKEVRLAIRKLCIPGVPSIVESVGA